MPSPTDARQQATVPVAETDCQPRVSGEAWPPTPHLRPEILNAAEGTATAPVRSSPASRPEAREHDSRVVDLSICIVNWNCRDYLRACLRSLAVSRQLVPLEIIVVDNASTDGVADMVAQEFPQVRLIRNARNEGFSRANNQAARLARGRYLFFLNNDTEVPPLALRRLIDFADAHPDIGLIGPRLRGNDGVVQVSHRPRPGVAEFLQRTTLLRWTGLFRQRYRQFRGRAFDPNLTCEVDILMGAAVLLRRTEFWRWGGWDEDFTFGGEDMELSGRVQRHARVVYWPGVEILHHGRVSTRQHSRFTAPNIAAGFARYLRKGGGSPARLLLYKLAVTLDAPVSLTLKFGEFLWRRLRGERGKAHKSWLSAQWSWYLLTRGLRQLWRA